MASTDDGCSWSDCGMAVLYSCPGDHNPYGFPSGLLRVYNANISSDGFAGKYLGVHAWEIPLQKFKLFVLVCNI